MSDLDRRAALAMGWTWAEHTRRVGGGGHWKSPDGSMFYRWSPSTDRNDLSELFREVERRGLEMEFIDKSTWEWSGLSDKSVMYTFWLLTADPAIICLAAVETLEAANG